MPQSLARNAIHLIFSTKLRQPFITPTVRDKLFAYLADRPWRVFGELKLPADARAQWGDSGREEGYIRGAAAVTALVCRTGARF